VINIIRDPMWGRNSEAYSECPFVTGEFAAAVIHGMRSDERGEGKFIQAFGGCKHFVPYDGAALSHASDYDLFSTYLPGFARCIEAGALNMMCSYTCDGDPSCSGGASEKAQMAGSSSCTNPRIMTSLAKGSLGFPGFFISDEGAVQDSKSPASFGAGCDTFLGSGGPSGDSISSWLADGAIPKGRLDDAATRTLLPRFLLGEFDPPSTVPFWDHAGGCGVVGSAEHQQIAYEAAAQSLVLLKNKGGNTLPLRASSTSGSGSGTDAAGALKVALLGPMTNATWMYVLLFHSHATSKHHAMAATCTAADTAPRVCCASRYNRYAYHPRPGTPLWVSLEEALTARTTSTGMTVSNTPGCTDTNSTTACTAINTAAIKSAAAAADVLVFMVGTGQ
jgi:beta-glucosidase